MLSRPAHVAVRLGVPDYPARSIDPRHSSPKATDVWVVAGREVPPVWLVRESPTPFAMSGQDVPGLHFHVASRRLDGDPHASRKRSFLREHASASHRDILPLGLFPSTRLGNKV